MLAPPRDHRGVDERKCEMKIFFLIAGFLFLGASFVWTFATEDELRIAGSVEWVCEPPTETVRTSACNTTQSSDTFLRLDMSELPITVCLGLTGIGFMTAAAAVGNRAPKPVLQAPMPYPQR